MCKLIGSILSASNDFKENLHNQRKLKEIKTDLTLLYFKCFHRNGTNYLLHNADPTAAIQCEYSAIQKKVKDIKNLPWIKLDAIQNVISRVEIGRRFDFLQTEIEKELKMLTDEINSLYGATSAQAAHLAIWISVLGVIIAVIAIIVSVFVGR